MAKLGFVNTPDAVAHSHSNQKKNQAEELAKKIRHYQTFYPNNKFITESGVSAICHKYGLLFGDASNYIGTIPEKNLAEIEQFKLLEQDMTKHEHKHWYTNGRHSFYHFEEFQNQQGSTGLSYVGYGYMLFQNSGHIFTKRAENGVTFTLTKPTFKICAPEKDFNTSGMKVDGYKLVHDIKDPVVLQPVNGGYLIVSKWGAEAEDESLVNPTQN